MAPFIGSMGLIRRKALIEAGGWKGDFLTEDMELSFRVFSKGWTSRFVNLHYGLSMPPHDLRNFRKQHFRWNYGNSQIIRNWFLPTLFGTVGSGQRKKRMLAFFASPGIYFNIFFLPFCCLLLFWQGLPMKESDNLSNAILTVILATLLVELLGELIYFLVIGRKEESVRVSLILKNYFSWLSISLNNSLSTLLAFIRIPLGFKITDKTSGLSSIFKSFPLIEFILSSVLIALGLTSENGLGLLQISMLSYGIVCATSVILWSLTLTLKPIPDELPESNLPNS